MPRCSTCNHRLPDDSWSRTICRAACLDVFVDRTIHGDGCAAPIHAAPNRPVWELAFDAPVTSASQVALFAYGTDAAEA